MAPHWDPITIVQGLLYEALVVLETNMNVLSVKFPKAIDPSESLVFTGVWGTCLLGSDASPKGQVSGFLQRAKRDRTLMIAFSG